MHIQKLEAWQTAFQQQNLQHSYTYTQKLCCDNTNKVQKFLRAVPTLAEAVRRMIPTLQEQKSL